MSTKNLRQPVLTEQDFPSPTYLRHVQSGSPVSKGYSANKLEELPVEEVEFSDTYLWLRAAPSHRG